MQHDPIDIRQGDPRSAAARHLLEQSHALMQSLFPPEDNHYLSVEALCAPEIRFFVAHDAPQARLLGTIALAQYGAQGEVKSMFVDPAARGRGVAKALLAHVEDCARRSGVQVLRLETGHLLTAAVALYRAQGFVPCGPFGDYTANATSLFMEKQLG